MISDRREENNMITDWKHAYGSPGTRQGSFDDLWNVDFKDFPFCKVEIDKLERAGKFDLYDSHEDIIRITGDHLGLDYPRGKYERLEGFRAIIIRWEAILKKRNAA